MESAAAAGEPTDKAMEGYFGNTMMFRDEAGRIIEVIYYRPDHTLRSWRDDEWVEGQWLINNGQDNSTICQTRGILGGPASWCHAFAPYKRVGDRWISPETSGGHPAYPATAGGIPVAEAAGQNVIAGSGPPPSLVMSLEAGLVPPDQPEGVPERTPAEELQELGRLSAVAGERAGHLSRLGDHADQAIAGYFGNTMVVRDAGDIVEAVKYRADHTMCRWRNGSWTEGRWVVNTGQDNSTICHTFDVLRHGVTWCHAFAPGKQADDRWISPETAGGHPAYPLTVGGVPVVEAGGRLVVAGTDRAPSLVVSLEADLAELGTP